MVSRKKTTLFAAQAPPPLQWIPLRKSGGGKMGGGGSFPAIPLPLTPSPKGRG